MRCRFASVWLLLLITASVPLPGASPLAGTPATQGTLVWPTAGWTRATPASQRLDAEGLARLDRDIESGVYGYIDHLLVVRGGHLVVDERYARDYRTISRGRTGPIGCGEGCDDPAWLHEFNYFHPTWHPYYRGRDVHTLQSVTKSMAATVIGIALGRGDIRHVSVPMLSFFKDRDLSRVDPRLHKATLEDLLTMRSGIEWHEGDRPLDDTNTTVQLEKSKDWIQFTLDQPMDAAPGTKWTYNSGGSQLLSGIIRTATGRFIDDYAGEMLFRPLGIRDVHWKKTPTGHPDTEGGLYLSAGDLAKIGLLYLRDGMWEGPRILPDGWVRAATTPHVTGLPGRWNYGYQWWLTERDGVDIWAGQGFGGQLLIVIPSRDIVAVVHAWNVFGGRRRAIFDPLVAALLAPADAPAAPGR
jgi:CubicO group peptidase (beta-lactamase class C family)